ncbi:phosphotransferase family protein [Chryseomicrobium palamuruense]|uniref:Phosphotransferase family protein n=1 Tax=Chryseomicrobium palamuruense TaxID=682973 RepID=A0ABV8UYP6_9BACL
MHIQQLAKHFNLHIRSVTDVPESFSSTVYRCELVSGEHIYIKVPYTKLKFQREVDAYAQLKGKVAVPDLLDVWEGDEQTVGALLLSELKGETLGKLSTEKEAFHVGVYHAQLHEIRPEEGMETSIDNEFPNWREFVDRMFYSFAEDTKKQISAKKLDAALMKYETMKNEMPPLDGPAFLHMDFRPANILVHNETVTGSIDFESVRFGVTEMDFTKLYRDYLQKDSALFKAYQQGYKSIRPLIDLQAVLPFYRFTDAFNSIGWCERRGVEKNRAFLEQNLSLLDEFLK